jgi:hypothetical protein
MELQKTFNMNLPVPLDQEQKAKLGQRMSEVEILINQKEQSKKAVSKRYSEEIEDLEAELYGLAKQFENNAVTVEVECRVDYNTPERGQKTITRLDTNEEVKVYDMSPEEIKAIEEPELFDAQSNNYPQEILSAYEIEIDKLFQPEEYEGNIFIVYSAEVLGEHEISIENINDESLKEIIGSLALRLNATNKEHENIILSAKHFFFTESAESEDLSWYFFKNLNPIIQEDTTLAIQYDPSMMDKEEIVESYSGDVLAHDKIRSHFQIGETMYVTTGLSGSVEEGHTNAIAYELIPKDDYTNETHVYEDKKSSEHPYEGQVITYRKKEYVLSNEIEIVFPKASKEENEFKEYKLPEKGKEE